MDSLECLLFGFVDFRLDFAPTYQKLLKLIVHSRNTTSCFSFHTFDLLHVKDYSFPCVVLPPPPSNFKGKKEKEKEKMVLGRYAWAWGQMIARLKGFG